MLFGFRSALRAFAGVYVLHLLGHYSWITDQACLRHRLFYRHLARIRLDSPDRPPSVRQNMRNFAMSLAAVFALAYASDWAAYRFSDSWNNVLQYNFVRGLFNDFGRVPWIPEASEYKNAGWSKNDYLMFKSWFASHDIYSFDKISSIANGLAAHSPLFVPQQIVRWFKVLITTPQLVAMLACQVALLVALQRARVTVLLLLAGLGCAIMISALTGRPPQYRVLFTLTATGFLCSLAIAFAEDRDGYGPSLRKSLVHLFLAAIGLSVGFHVLRQHAISVSEAFTYRERLRNAAPYLSDKVVVWGGTLEWEWLVTPTYVSPLVKERAIVAIGALTRTPIGDATLQEVGIDDLSKTMCTDPNMRIISSDKYISYLEAFCEQHYQTSPNYKVIYTLGPQRSVFAWAF